MTADRRSLGSDDLAWSARALELAAKADYGTSPNPMVGAVVLDREGHFAGEGFHRAKGAPHAEQEALEQAGTKAKGGILYVNLEPCTHDHRSPCCADALIDAGVSRVVVSMPDPDVRVEGRGIKRLEDAGISVKVGVHEQRARRLNEFYVKHRLTGRPFVAVKFAMSLDGKIATRTGRSRWISSKEARRHSHRLRHQHDAILVGINTVMADDPELTSREAGEDVRQPVRVVLDSQLRIRQSAKIVGSNTLIASTKQGHVGVAEVLTLPATDSGRVSLPHLLDELGKRDMISLLVEGGGEVHAAFLEQGLVDKVYAYIAPLLIGGRDAPGPLAGTGVEELDLAAKLSDVDLTRLGPDVVISGYVEDVHGNR